MRFFCKSRWHKGLLRGDDLGMLQGHLPVQEGDAAPLP